jgi:predicted transcriptional regulator
MNRGKSDKATKTDRLTITLGAGQARQIAAIARRLRTSRATIIRWALDEYIERNALSTQRGRRSRKPR